MSTYRPPALPVSSDGLSRDGIPGVFVALLSLSLASLCFFMLWFTSDYRGARLFGVGSCVVTSSAEKWEEPNLAIYKITGLGEKAYKVTIRTATGDVYENLKLAYEVARLYRKTSCPIILENK